MERGEIAIRASIRAKRAAARKPESLNEAVSNRTDEILARREAEAALKAPERLVSACGEAIRPLFRFSYSVDTLQNPNLVNVAASEHRVDLAASVGSGVVESAVDAAQSAQAENSLEKMLCHQIAAGHCAAMKLIARSLNMSGVPVEMARLSNAAARMMQVYQEGLLTLQKLRTGGKQTVLVQHVQVSEGGQAVDYGKREVWGGGLVVGEVEKIVLTPHERRRGWLKNGNPPGDLASVARCGARTRRGTHCQCPAMPNGRCRLHGGLSTGPKTAEGIERIRRAVTKHGRYSMAVQAERRHFRGLLKECRELVKAMRGPQLPLVR